jgi:shikimate dehydrogenase
MPPLTGHSRFVGILADPIHHVMAPTLINALYAARGEDRVMVPMHVAPEALARVVDGLRAIRSFDGFVATMPHKTAMPALCDVLTDEARQGSAVNIVRRTADGRMVGGLLDGLGFVAGLRAHGIEPRGLRAYVAGAGGAGSAIAWALAAAGVARLTVANRSVDKARILLARVREAHPVLPTAVGTLDPSGHDLVVNGTSLGLREGDALPLDATKLEPGMVVAEIIMKPAETALMAAARARGCRVHPGLPMLEAQVELMAAFMRGDPPCPPEAP